MFFFLLPQSASNPYTSVHRPKRRKKRPNRNMTPKKHRVAAASAVEESDSDYIPGPVDIGGSRNNNPMIGKNTNGQLDFSQWDPSPKKKKKQPIRIPTPSN